MKTPVNSKRCIAFTAIGGSTWTGGALYLKNLLITLRSLDEAERPYVFYLTGAEEKLPSELSNYVDQHLIWPSETNKLGFSSRVRSSVRRRVFRENAMSAELHEHGVTCVFSITNFGKNFQTPLVGWIPDFQHVHLPQMFSQEILNARDQSFSHMALFADRVVLSSQNAAEDFQRFVPHLFEKGRVSSFVAHVPEEIYDLDPGWVCSRYHLPQRFFYLPNQFWKHKNHEIVIHALAIAIQHDPSITVVCTGNTTDERNPTFFSELLFNVSSSGVREQFIFLGMVPHAHIFSLMRQSVALLQPSLFEGWSTTVEEAKTMGKSVILSDIPVHREQNPPSATFFDPRKPEVLAGCLLSKWKENKFGPEVELEKKALQEVKERDQRCARGFLSVVDEAMAAKAQVGM